MSFLPFILFGSRAILFGNLIVSFLFIQFVSNFSLDKIIHRLSKEFELIRNAKDHLEIDYEEDSEWITIDSDEENSHLPSSNKNHLILSEISCTFPLVIKQIIHDYCIDSNHIELYENVMKELIPFMKLFGKTRNDFDFHRRDFVKNLYYILPSKGKIPSDTLFYIDLKRLFLKWIIYQGKHQSERGFKSLLKSIRPFIHAIEEYGGECLYSAEFSSLTNCSTLFDFHLNLKELFRYEILERPEIPELFKSAQDKFYHDKKFNCLLLKKTFFNNNFSSNLTLKAAIYIYDLKGEMKRCFHSKVLRYENGNYHYAFPSAIPITSRDTIDNI